MRITELLPANMAYCIAGGWAACPALAADVDVWIYGIPADKLDGTLAFLLDWLTNMAARRNKGVPADGFKPKVFQSQVESRAFLAYEGVDCRIEKVGVFYRANAQPLHIMVTDAPDPGHILSGFDVSTHAIAIGDDGRIWKHKDWTPVTVPPVALLVNEHTPDRMARIATRFGHTR